MDGGPIEHSTGLLNQVSEDAQLCKDLLKTKQPLEGTKSARPECILSDESKGIALYASSRDFTTPTPELLEILAGLGTNGRLYYKHKEHAMRFQFLKCK